MARLGRTGWHAVQSYWDQGGVGGREPYPPPIPLCFHPSNVLYPASYQSYSCGGNDVTWRHGKRATSPMGFTERVKHKMPNAAVVIRSVLDKRGSGEPSNHETHLDIAENLVVRLHSGVRAIAT